MSEEVDKSNQSKSNFLRKWLPVIFFGALGSGLWMLVGPPIVDWIKNKFIEFGSLFFSSYLDNLHVNIGKGLHEKSAILFYYIFLVTMASFYILLPFGVYRIRKKIINEKEESEPLIPQKTKLKITIMFYISLVLSIYFVPIFISGIIKRSYNNNAVVFVERSIEILAPYISEKERLLLRSEYRAIDSANDFYQFEEKLRRLSKDKAIELPEFSSYK